MTAHRHRLTPPDAASTQPVGGFELLELVVDESACRALLAPGADLDRLDLRASACDADSALLWSRRLRTSGASRVKDAPLAFEAALPAAPPPAEVLLTARRHRHLDLPLITLCAALPPPAPITRWAPLTSGRADHSALRDLLRVDVALGRTLERMGLLVLLDLRSLSPAWITRLDLDLTLDEDTRGGRVESSRRQQSLVDLHPHGDQALRLELPLRHPAVAHRVTLSIRARVEIEARAVVARWRREGASRWRWCGRDGEGASAGFSWRAVSPASSGPHPPPASSGPHPPPASSAPHPSPASSAPHPSPTSNAPDQAPTSSALHRAPAAEAPQPLERLRLGPLSDHAPLAHADLSLRAVTLTDATDATALLLQCALRAPGAALSLTHAALAPATGVGPGPWRTLTERPRGVGELALCFGRLTRDALGRGVELTLGYEIARRFCLELPLDAPRPDRPWPHEQAHALTLRAALLPDALLPDALAPDPHTLRLDLAMDAPGAWSLDLALAVLSTDGAPPAALPPLSAGPLTRDHPLTLTLPVARPAAGSRLRVQVCLRGQHLTRARAALEAARLLPPHPSHEP